jgi:hypothetical protein
VPAFALATVSCNSLIDVTVVTIACSVSGIGVFSPPCNGENVKSVRIGKSDRVENTVFIP